MSSIGGKKRENTGGGDFSKKVGLFEANVIAITFASNKPTFFPKSPPFPDDSLFFPPILLILI